MWMLLDPATTKSPAFAPRAILELPVVALKSALWPIATLELPLAVLKAAEP